MCKNNQSSQYCTATVSEFLFFNMYLTCKAAASLPSLHNRLLPDG